MYRSFALLLRSMKALKDCVVVNNIRLCPDRTLRTDPERFLVLRIEDLHLCAS